MKIKLDENIPAGLVPYLARLGHDVDTVIHENLGGQDDLTVWKATQKEGRLFITQDMDFSDTRRFIPGTHHGILLVRLRRPGRRQLLLKISRVFRKEGVDDWPRLFRDID